MVFKDSKLNWQLENKGYVVIPFFTTPEVKALQLIYNQNKSDSPFFHSTTFFASTEVKEKVKKEVGQIFIPQIEKQFNAYRELGASFLAKPRGEGGAMPIHQDWTIVDETKFGSYTIWVPLQDVSEENGAITVLEGSHQLTKTLRGPSLPVVIKEIEPQIKQRMKTLRMKAGEAFIFNHALIHASHLNFSPTTRIAATFGLVPEQAQLLFYHANENGSIDKYEVEDDFFMRYDTHGERPTFATLKETTTETFEQITEKQLLAFCNDYKMRNMKPLFKDAMLQAQFEKDGFVLVDFLNDTQVKELKDHYATLNNDHIPDYGFHVSINNTNHDFVAGVLNTIREKMKQHADRIFQDNKIITASYVVKEPNPIGLIPPHQDWSFTEEGDNYSANIWTALVDTNMKNGALGIIAGSHKFFDHPRASPPPQFKTPLDVHMFPIFQYLKVIEMKAGQALIFDSRTIHASPPNVSNETRLAVGFVATQADAPSRHYYLKPDSDAKQLLKYEANDYFYTHYTNDQLSALYNEGKLPEGMNLLETVDNLAGEISESELLEKIVAAGNTINVELCEHLAKLFNYKPEEPKKEEVEAREPEPENIVSAFNIGNEETKDWNPEEVVLEHYEVEQIIAQPFVTTIDEEPPYSVPAQTDERTFFKKYTPLNILREIKERMLA